jgi:hypothetical protein
MEQNPTLEADSDSDTEEILRLLFHRKVHYRIHNTRSFFLLQTFIPFDEFRLRIISGTMNTVTLGRSSK